MYKSIIRPLLFLLNPEKAHSFLLSALRSYSHLPFIRSGVRRHYQATDKQLIWNRLVFKNRIGLSAGFDKAAQAFGELADFGFGFIEVGTVTPSAQPGNPAPRIFRLPKADSLISRTGFNNPGLEVVRNRLKRKTGAVLMGVNINKNPDSAGEEAVNDFLKMYAGLYDVADYFTLNWGSVDVTLMHKVLQALTTLQNTQKLYRPILLKVPADATTEAMDAILECVRTYRLQGVIATGPTMDRSLLHPYTTARLEAIGAGGVSGKGIGTKSVEAVKYLRSHSEKGMLIIGAGGVMTAEDARRMLDAGANLIQIYSAFIYEGPAIVKKMIKAIRVF